MAWQKANRRQKGDTPAIRLGPGHSDGKLPFMFARISEQTVAGFHVVTRVCVPMQKPPMPETHFEGREIGYYPTIGEARTAGKLALSEDSDKLRKEIDSGNASSTPASGPKAPG